MPRWTRKSKRSQRFFGGQTQGQSSQASTNTTGSPIPVALGTNIAPPETNTSTTTQQQGNANSSNANSVEQISNEEKALFEKVCPNLDYNTVKSFIDRISNKYEDPENPTTKMTSFYYIYKSIAIRILKEDKKNFTVNDETIKQEVNKNATDGDGVLDHEIEEAFENPNTFVKKDSALNAIGKDMEVFNQLAAYLWIGYIEAIRDTLIEEKFVTPKE